MRGGPVGRRVGRRRTWLCVAAGVGRVGGEHRCGAVWGLGGGMWRRKLGDRDPRL